MYPYAQHHQQAFWRALREQLLQAGLDDLPNELTQPSDYLHHWQDPRLLLSQTCGFPAVSLLAGHVRVLGAFHYDAPGCDGYRYSSQILIRRDDPRQRLEDFQHSIAVCSERHSQSGYHALRSHLVTNTLPQPFFRAVSFSGGHRHSARLLAEGKADIAALDSVSAWLLAQEEPEVFARLRPLAQTAHTPGLPLITRSTASEDTVARLRAALIALLDNASVAGLLADMRITGFTALDAADYQALRRDAERNAALLGSW